MKVLLAVALCVATASCSFWPRQKTSSTESANLSAWKPGWVTVPDRDKRRKGTLEKTVAFTDDYLGWVPGLKTDDEKKANEKEQALKRDFMATFARIEACHDIVFERSKPQDADFDFQLFDGIDGRAGKYQWVLYRTDVTERLGYGEDADLQSVTKSVCDAVRQETEQKGGRIE
jgi:hypothetical protein